MTAWTQHPQNPFGCELKGFSTADIGLSEIEHLRNVLAANVVLVLRDQMIDDLCFQAFLERLAPLTFTVGEQRVSDKLELNVVSNIGRRTPPRSVFHSDTSYVRRPPSFTALRAVMLPEQGGETLFSNQYDAYDRLDESLKSTLRHARVKHVVTGLELEDEAESACWHPLFRRHPISGRTALYLSTPERCVAIAGADVADPAGLIEELYEHSLRPDHLYVHRWRPGDVVIWDNRCAMHRADHSAVVGNRVLHRGMCEGEEPLAAFA